MPLTPTVKASYELVVKDLEAKRIVVHSEVATGQKRLRELDDKISGLYREMDTPIPVQALIRAPSSVQTPPNQKYASISVHWAILHALSEAKGPMTTSEIAEALTKGGVKTRAANFANNVSAVLTTNMRPAREEEVEVNDGRWSLTEIGRNKITFIVASVKFRRACPWIADTVGAA